MHIQILLPDLLFAKPESMDGPHPITGLNLPSLSLLLAEALEHPSPIAVESNLAQACGLSTEPPYGVAALLAEEEGLKAKQGIWLRLDPVRMRAGQDTVYCLGQQGLDLDHEQSEAFIASINSLWQEDGLQLQMGENPLHWYVQIKACDMSTVPLSQVLGKPISEYLPKGLSAGLWQKRITEIEMLLNMHPVNRKRQQLGRPTVDSLWAWGEGRYPSLHYARKDVLYGSDAICHAVAKAAGLPNEIITPRINDIFQGAYQKIMIYEPSLQTAMIHGDLSAWQDTVVKLEHQFFLPSLLALRQKTIDQLVLDFAEGRAFTITRRSLKKWWRRSINLTERLNIV